MDPRITYSQIGTFLSCAHRHYLAYVLGLRRKRDADALRLGSAVHLALELEARGESSQEAIAHVIERYETQIAAAEGKGDHDFADKLRYEAQTVTCMLTAYFWRWSHLDARRDVEDVEAIFSMPIRRPNSRVAMRRYVYAGKMDMLARGIIGGELALIEHKTTSDTLEPGSPYWRRATFGMQISLYMLAARAIGQPCESIIYDVLRKPLLRPKQVRGEGRIETPVEFGERVWREAYGMDPTNPDTAKTMEMFERRVIHRTEEDLREAQQSLFDSVRLIDHAVKNNLHPQNDRSCHGFGTCEFYQVCSMQWAPPMAPPDGYEYVRDTHQELLVEVENDD